MLIKDMSAEEKLVAILELFEQGKNLEEVTKIAGYSRKTNVKTFLKNKGYDFDEAELLVKDKQVSADSQLTVSDFALELDNRQAKENLIDLLSSYNDIKNMLEWYKSNDSQMSASKIEVVEVLEQGIKIDLPTYEGAAYRASVRINPIIWAEFDDFAKEHPEFDKASLIAQAMKEYIKKHK